MNGVVTPDELAALENVRGYAAAGRVRVSSHARARMKQRNVRREDLRSALVYAAACSAQVEGTWKVAGPDADGDDLTVVVAIEEGLLVVTVF